VILRPVRLALLALLAAAAAPARAHHGTAAVGAIGAEGPGAGLETSSPLPLGQGTVFALLKTEYVPFQQRAGFTEQKQFSSFNTVALGYGLTPWLSAFVLQPYNVKAQDVVGTNHGLGDTNLIVSASFKLDDGFQRVPEKESLDDLADWHFGLWASCSIPVGPTATRDDLGGYFAPDMQTGFNGPSPGVGVTMLKQLATDWTVLAEANYQHFFLQRYGQAGLSYQFGGETRLGGALVYRLWASGSNRVDLVPEFTVLNLQRDRSDEGTGTVVPLQASGGTVLYGQLGARARLGAFAVGASIKRAVASRLNEGADQQGSEGLEVYRAALVLSYVPGL
jgi:hypothetical protein